MNTSRLVGLVLVVAAMVLNSGCASYVNARASQREIATRRIMASQDEGAIKALKMGVEPESAIRAVKLSDGVGVGVDLLSLDTLGEHPWRTAAAAALDALLTYGAYQGVQSLNNSGSGDNTSKQNNTTINVQNADNTTINVDNTDTTTTTTTDTTTDTATDNHSGNGNNR